MKMREPSSTRLENREVKEVSSFLSGRGIVIPLPGFNWVVLDTFGPPRYDAVGLFTLEKT